MITKTKESNHQYGFDIMRPQKKVEIGAQPPVVEPMSNNTKPSQSTINKFFRKVLKVVAYLVFVAVMVVITPKILSSVLKTPYPLATITSGSMWPVLRTNDLILMKGIDPADTQIGQIIIFKHQGGFTIHRLIRKENGKFVTKGDANGVEDAPINPEDVIGRVVYIGSNPFRIPVIGVIARSLGPKIANLENTKL